MAEYSIEPNPRIAFKVRHEDAHVAVVDKPAGIVTQPGLGHEGDTLLNGLFALFGNKLQKLGKARDFGLLHRLDKPASGLVAVGLSPAGYDGLRADFEARRVVKFYLCIVARTPKQEAGVVDLGIAENVPRRGEKKIARVTKSADAKDAQTAYRVVRSSEHGCLIEARPLTGRLHQVRVHMKLIGCPLLGDDVYATAAMAGASPRLALHAHRLVFTHPVTGDSIDVRSPLPADLKAVVRRLKLHEPESGLAGRA